MQGKERSPIKKRAYTPAYVSPNQLVIPGFEFPFDKELDMENIWVLLSKSIPWDAIVSQYMKCFPSIEGGQPINGRVVIGSIIIKHVMNYSDRETLESIRENPYLQYFLGYNSFCSVAPFTAPLFVTIRKRLNLELLEKINEIIICHGKGESSHSMRNSCEDPDDPSDSSRDGGRSKNPTPADVSTSSTSSSSTEKAITHKGKLLMDATVAPQNITYPTDLKLLNEARLKC